MPRNLDLTALRSFVTVADAGGVTRAAGLLNLTQSAVSMQLKRLEEQLGLALMDRSGRTIGLTAAGEQLLGYGKRLLALNDEVYGRLTAQEYEGELRLGVPHDIIYPYMPRVLKAFSAAFPRMRVQLTSALTVTLPLPGPVPSAKVSVSPSTSVAVTRPDTGTSSGVVCASGLMTGASFVPITVTVSVAVETPPSPSLAR